jgi:signal transduction histidine kinase
MTDWLKADGEMAERIRSYDWSATALGPIGEWPDVLKTTLALCLDSRFPQAIMWGSDLVTLHNDAFSPILGNKPAALGQRFSEVWKEVWGDVGPIAERAWAGQATYVEDYPLVLERSGEPEQAYFTFCYSPIRDHAGRVVAILDTVTETTATVVANQRLGFLAALAAEVADATSPGMIMAATTRMLGEHLRLSGCAYAEMDADENGLTVRGDWVQPGSPRLLGRYSLANYGEFAVRSLRAGQPLMINDLKQLQPSDAAVFRASHICAAICMPLIKDGRLTALMAVHDKAPRTWSVYERTLVSEVTQRCWAHIERARAEVQLRELNESLEERVALMVAEREATVAEHHETRKMETIGQLTGGIAHDFNNLLTPIMGTLDLVRRRMDDERSRELVDCALQAADRARTLVGRLLTFARRQTLKPRAVALETLVNDMRDLIVRSLGPMIEVAIDIPSHLPAVIVDPHQLELAILNLAVNARDAMGDGGRLEISATLDDVPSAAVRGLSAGRYACLTISDNGSGMSAETLKRCVDPFFSTKGIGKGTGLGLSMVQGLAAQSGGGLGIESEVGLGTRVSMWLPITATQAASEGDETADAPRAPRPTRVLLVDDEDMVRQTVTMQLEDLGYQVTGATSAAAALRLIDEGLAPDVLVTDHIMPDKTGAQLARELHQRLPSLPVLIITGYANLTPAQMHGFEILAKPFRRSELAARLVQLLSAA